MSNMDTIIHSEKVLQHPNSNAAVYSPSSLSVEGIIKRVLNFYPVICTIDFTVWKRINTSKLTEWKLNTPILPIIGTLNPFQGSPIVKSCDTPSTDSLNDFIKDTKVIKRHTHTTLGWRLHINRSAFNHSERSMSQFHPSESSGINSSPLYLIDQDISESQSEFILQGLFFNANSAQDFRSIDRREFVTQHILQLLELLHQANERLLNIPPFKVNKHDDDKCNIFVTHLHSKIEPSYYLKNSTILPNTNDSFDCINVNLLDPPTLLACNSSVKNIIALCCPFILLCYADLKSYLYYYNVSIPALRPTTDFMMVSLPVDTLTLSSLPFQLTSTELTKIGYALFIGDDKTTINHLAGYRGVCVIIRQKRYLHNSQFNSLSTIINYESFFEQHTIQTNNPLLQLIEFLRINHMNCHPFYISETTCLLSLWEFLILYSRYCCLESTNTSFKALEQFTLWLSTIQLEFAICCVDSIRDEGDNLGWPLRSVLFCLGSLGLVNGILPLFVYRDGIQGTQINRSFNTTQYPNDIDYRTVSRMFYIIMPSRDMFGFNHHMIYSSLSENDSQQVMGMTLGGWLRCLSSPPLHQQNRQTTSITFIVDLRRHLDPISSQADAVQLNIQLIQWRILPSFNSAKLQQLRILLIGMGTLGCAISQILIGWGVTQLTLIDNGRVSLSSPVRQVLYKHSDATWNNGRGRLKVIAAKERLLEIRPDLSITAIPFEIPMPGHIRFLLDPEDNEKESHLTFNSQFSTKFSEKKKSEFITTIQNFENLLDTHDVILLLTDSRESRWLPSLIIASSLLRRQQLLYPVNQTPSDSICTKIISPTISNNQENVSDDSVSLYCNINEDITQMTNIQTHFPKLFDAPPLFHSPLCITVALGFDSFVVMRHGYNSFMKQNSLNETEIISSSIHTAKDNTIIRSLACYFCNDLAAPSDSISKRSLDQQCTVTRPGISSFAASIASELIAAISQHPLAPNPPHSSKDWGPYTIPTQSHEYYSCLGAVPHTIRGTLGNFHLSLTETEAFKYCICCSHPICETYCSPKKYDFLVSAISHSEILEELSGLAAAKKCYREEEVFCFDEFEDVLTLDT